MTGTGQVNLLALWLKHWHAYLGGGGALSRALLTWNHSKIVQTMDYFYSDFTYDEEIVVACFLSFFLLFLYTEADKAVGETCTAIKSFTDWAIVNFK